MNQPPQQQIISTIPPCGTFNQINDILQYIKGNKFYEINELNQIISVDTYFDLPESIKNIYNEIRQTPPITSGGMKIGIWALLPNSGICRDADDLILKIEGNNSPTNDGCVMYWIDEQLQLQEKYPRLMYCCTGMYVEIYMNALVDVIYRNGYIPGVLKTPQQYYIKNYKNAPNSIYSEAKKYKRAIFTLQQRISGDVLDLINYQKIINQNFPIDSRDDLLNYKFVVNYITQITFSLHMLQKLLHFRHNDFWIRNCFIQFKNKQQVENIDIKQNGYNVNLNNFDYYKFEVKGKSNSLKNFFIANTGLTMKISDFGHSRFETNKIIVNNFNWIKNEKFAWSNKLKESEYVDYLVQLAGWVVAIFIRFDEALLIPDNIGYTKTYNYLVNNWIKNWIINLKTSSEESIKSWLKSLFCAVFIFMYVLIGPNNWDEYYSISNFSLQNLAENFWNAHIQPYRQQLNITSTKIFEIIAIEISNIYITKDNKTINTVFIDKYSLSGDLYNNFVSFLHGTVNNHTTLQLRIPKPLEYPFSMINVFDFLYTAFSENDKIISTTLPRGKSEFTFKTTIPNYDKDNMNDSNKFFNFYLTPSIPGPQNVSMSLITDRIQGLNIPAIQPIKSFHIGQGIEVYEFENYFSPLGYVNPSNYAQVLDAYGKNGNLRWVDINDMHNKKQFINVVRIPKQAFNNIIMELYHYNPPATIEEKNIRPKKTLSDILGNIDNESVGVIMAGDYFNYKNYELNNDGLYEVGKDENGVAICTPPSCDATIGYVRTSKFTPIIEDERPIDFYRNFYGLLCFQTDNNNVLKNVSINTYDEVDKQPNKLSDCSMILSGSPVLLRDSMPFFFPRQIQEYANRNRIDSQEVMDAFIPRTRATNRIMKPVNENETPLIIGGQGLHFFSDNPRSAVGINELGDLLLVTVEGRNQRGAGVDIIQLQKIMKSLGCVSAINEDGGGTSDILYKPERSYPSMILNTNPTHKLTVGSVGLTPSTAVIFRSPPRPYF